MDDSLRSPLGVCAAPAAPENAARTVAHAHYIHEILAHAGLCYSAIGVDDVPDALDYLSVLVTAGDVAFDESAKQALAQWVNDGGAWLAVGGLCDLAELLGVEPEPPSFVLWAAGTGTLGEGYLSPENRSHPLLAHLEIPLHFFNGAPVRATDSQVLASVLDAHQRPTGRSAVTIARRGSGLCIFVAPDVTGSVVRISQGICVTRDGSPSPDGTAPVCDGVLKSDDGQVLDWEFDRAPVPGVPGFRAFLQPVADQWRELLLRGVFCCCEHTGAALPLLWLYPRDLPAIGHLSHDSDGGDADRARSMLAVLKRAGIKSTWCVLSQGYPPDVLDGIRSAGCELAMHYDAMSPGTAWAREQFEAQFGVLTRLFGEAPVTNKNHYLRWQGDVDFYEWCEWKGIRLDQSKGASKTGEAGFNFGTCHPFFPVAPDGHTLDVLALATPTQDMVVFARPEFAGPLLDAVHRSFGVYHLLFHPAHIEKPGVEDALLGAVARAQSLGMEWWTAREISEWERARRLVRWLNYTSAADGVRVTLAADAALPDANVLWFAPEGALITTDGEAASARRVRRWGFDLLSVTVDIAAGGSTRIALQGHSPAASKEDCNEPS